MKLFFCILAILSYFNLSYATTSSCTENSITFTLNSDSVQPCKSLKVDGIYKIKICASGSEQSLLSGQDQSVRSLFRDVADKNWMTRVDHLDFTNNITVTEIFQIDDQFSKFLVSKIKSKMNGAIVEKFNCYGTIK